MLEIWGRRSSSNVQALMWCVGELGLPHVRHDAGHIYGVTDTPEFLVMNPNGTVPVLVDGSGEPIWETGAILRYLAARYGSDDFWPTDPSRRAQVDKWADWAKINITLGFTAPVFWRVVRTAPKKRDPAAIATALEALNRRLAIANHQLSGQPYLAGSALTVADIQFGHVLYRYHDIDIARAPFPAIERYYRLLEQRPAFRQHVMVPYDELRVRD